MCKIAHCPFCGEQPTLYVRKGYETKYAFGCDDMNCFLWVPKDVNLDLLHTYTSCFVHKKDLIFVWNTRPSFCNRKINLN